MLRTREEWRRWDHGQFVVLAELVRELVVWVLLMGNDSQIKINICTMETNNRCIPIGKALTGFGSSGVILMSANSWKTGKCVTLQQTKYPPSGTIGRQFASVKAPTNRSRFA